MYVAMCEGKPIKASKSKKKCLEKIFDYAYISADEAKREGIDEYNFRDILGYEYDIVDIPD